MPTSSHGGAAWSNGKGTSDRTCLRGIRTGLHDLAGKEHPIEHAYKVSGRGCMISRVRNIRSNMLTRYQVGAAGSHGLETTDRRTGLQDLTVSEQLIEHAYKVSGRGCRISRVRNTIPYMPTGYQDRASGSHGLGTSDRTCLRGIKMGLQDLKGKEHGFGTPD